MERWWQAAVAAILGVVSAGCESRGCSLYACINNVELRGNVAIESDVTAVEATLCREAECHVESIDLRADAPCDTFRTDICLKRQAGASEVRAVWSSTEGGDDEPVNVPFQLKLVDAATGAVLLDETRSITATVTRKDECHVCWHAEQEL